MPTPIVTLEGVGKTFKGGVTALRDLGFTVHEGEFISLLGPSGCGKSTALRILAGLAEASAGSVTWSAAAPSRAHDFDIGFVFQEPTLMPWSTVARNVALPLRLRDLPRAEVDARVASALDAVGLKDFARSYPRQLSGGMKMRVSIARALVTRPRLLLLDEPFAALDEITRFKLNDDLLALQAEAGLTTVFVTHSVFESVYLSSRILVMAARPGRIAEEIEVPVPYPRDEAFRTSAEYGALCRSASAALRRAIEVSGT